MREGWEACDRCGRESELDGPRLAEGRFALCDLCLSVLVSVHQAASHWVARRPGRRRRTRPGSMSSQIVRC